jgi:hypothetical protein
MKFCLESTAVIRHLILARGQLLRARTLRIHSPDVDGGLSFPANRGE